MTLAGSLRSPTAGGSKAGGAAKKKKKKSSQAAMFDQFIDDPDHPALQRLYEDHPEARQTLASRHAREQLAAQAHDQEDETDSDEETDSGRGTVGIAATLGDGTSVHAGELVDFAVDMQLARTLQHRHGGFGSHMRCYAGKVGRVKKIDRDRDVRAKNNSIEETQPHPFWRAADVRQWICFHLSGLAGARPVQRRPAFLFQPSVPGCPTARHGPDRSERAPSLEGGVRQVGRRGRG